MKAWTLIVLDRRSARSRELRLPPWVLWLGLGLLSSAALAAGWAGYLLRASL